MDNSTLPIAQLSIKDIGMKGIIVIADLHVGVTRNGNLYTLDFMNTLIAGDTTVTYSLSQQDQSIADALNLLMDRLRLEIDNYDAIPDDWLTPEGRAIKDFFYQSFQPDIGETFNENALQRRLDQAEKRQIVEDIKPSPVVISAQNINVKEL